jgi:thymidylate synthase ThyX
MHSATEVQFGQLKIGRFHLSPFQAADMSFMIKCSEFRDHFVFLYRVVVKCSIVSEGDIASIFKLLELLG